MCFTFLQLLRLCVNNAVKVLAYIQHAVPSFLVLVLEHVPYFVSFLCVSHALHSSSVISWSNVV